jgi:hypothetical protein
VLVVLVTYLLPLRSTSTRVRLKAAMTRLIELDITPERLGQVLKHATRPSGSLNVRSLERYADWMLARRER